MFWQSLGWACLPLMVLPILVIFTPDIKFINRLTRDLIVIIDWLNWGIGEIIKWALVLLILAIVASIIALSIFGLSFTKLDEVPTYFHASVIMLGSAVTLLAGQHVRVDIFYGRFSIFKKARLEIISFYALIVPVCILLLWVSQNFVAGSWRTFEGSNDPNGIQGVWLLKTLLPLFAGTVLAQAFAIAGRAALILNGQTPPNRPRAIEPLFTDTPNTALGQDMHKDGA